MAKPAKVEQRYGVVDGASGYAWVIVPHDRDAARALNAQHDRRFWCSTVTGGCGAQLSLHVGEEKAPHFSHYPGQAKSCPFAYNLEALERSYLHLALQHTLRRWLAGQGFAATLEHTLPGGGRADLHVKVDPGEQTIEVQLSPLPLATWEARTSRYARHVDRVTWLFGPHAGQHLLTTTIRLNGYALGVKLSSQSEADAADPGTVQIGTFSRSAAHWVPLTACTLTENGITTPHVAAALAEHAVWKALEEAAAKNRLEGAAKPKPHLSDGGAGSLRDHTVFRAPKQSAPPSPAPEPRLVTPLTPPRVATQPRGTGRQPLSSYGWLDPGQWAPPNGWGFLQQLDPHLRDAGKLMAYLVSRIEAGGPDWTLAFPDVDDAGSIQDALEAAGLIQLEDPCGGVRRWRRAPQDR